MPKAKYSWVGNDAYSAVGDTGCTVGCIKFGLGRDIVVFGGRAIRLVVWVATEMVKDGASRDILGGTATIRAGR